MFLFPTKRKDSRTAVLCDLISDLLHDLTMAWEILTRSSASSSCLHLDATYVTLFTFWLIGLDEPDCGNVAKTVLWQLACGESCTGLGTVPV
ncbi:hypothetical protein AVEN_87767-1 [Araneus ventricosus]|uniref:Uncharacterized protein n=1 Tax=Araneus ventricosus TaxID=182803 RepID=A0A4Y2VGH9_ARAVE|nr:hypothetical protein AVEN_87767-1 [Araneus ventricosus]